MKLTILLFLVFIFTLYALPSNAARPSPEKSTQEIFNDIYVDTPAGSESIRVQATLDPTGLATSGNQTTANAYLLNIQNLLDVRMASGVLVSFASSPVSDSTYATLYTAPEAIKYAAITQNGGGDFLLRVGTTDYGYIFPGQSNYVPMNIASGSALSIKSASGTVSSGKLYINLYK